MHELILRLPQEQVEAVSDTLMDELGALSVSVQDADAGTGAERPLFGEPGMPMHAAGWDRSTLHALFTDEASADRATAVMLAEHGNSGVHLQALQPVAEQDWVRLTQSQFEPVAITDEFWIVPSWHEVPAAARHAVRMDPGLAFGTGTHPTTRMCLRWIVERAPALAPSWARVLDYGCGSGILAIGAALMGARGVEAVDTDPAALVATKANAQANGTDLLVDAPHAARGQYALVLANILATPLKLLAPLLCARVQSGGHLVLAGILERQADELAAAYAPWMAITVSDALDGWVLMTGPVSR